MDKELDDLFDELEGGSVAGDDETGNGTDDDGTGGSDDATHDEELDGDEGKEGETTGETPGEATGETTDETGEVDPVESLRAQNAALIARLNALEAANLATPAKPVGATGATTPTPAAVVPGKPKFLTDEDDIDDILSERDKLEGLLQRVYERAREDALPQEYKDLPSFLGEQVQRQMVLREGIREFFSANSDLLAVRKTVGALTNEVVAEHPEWNLSQVLTEAETRTRTLLGIKKPVVKTDGRNPALGGKGSSRKKTGDTRTSMQKELDDLMDL